jgi:hypothetical protein
MDYLPSSAFPTIQGLKATGSSLGTPVQSNVIFQKGEYELFDGTTQNWETMRFDAVLISVSQAKKIVKTEIAGRNGTVKEYIGLDDYAIQITGVITAENGKNPAGEIEALKRILDSPISIAVSSQYLQNLGIFSIDIESYDLGQQPGGFSYQNFTINATSSNPAEIFLNA